MAVIEKKTKWCPPRLTDNDWCSIQSVLSKAAKRA